MPLLAFPEWGSENCQGLGGALCANHLIKSRFLRNINQHPPCSHTHRGKPHPSPTPSTVSPSFLSSTKPSQFTHRCTSASLHTPTPYPMAFQKMPTSDFQEVESFAVDIHQNVGAS